MRTVLRNLVAGGLASAGLACFVAANSVAAERPNVLILMADDCTHNDLPIYGGINARTPHLEKFASEGMVFNRAYLTEAMCQPCRAELYSGQHPVRNGCAWNHAASRPDTKSLPQYLQPLGYRVGIAGKVHVLPQKAYPFESVPGFDPNCVHTPTSPHDVTAAREFMRRDPQQPFCLVIALVEPHVPWVMGDPSKYPPKLITLPPNIADTPRTREDFSKYLAEITYMDGQIGELLALLEEVGAKDNTLVLFTSEQGSQFPGNKWTNWDTGLHTALIARWPGRVPAGKRTDAIVHYADVLPTLLDINGDNSAEKSGAVDGRSFLPVLLGQASAHREFSYGVHNNYPEGPPYAIRSVSDGEYRYIRNLMPDEIYIEKHVMGTSGQGLLNNPYWGTWVWGASENRHTYELVKRYTRRPAEQLYHTSEDRYELVDLANDSAHAAVKARLSAELDRWLAQQHDPGAVLDTPEAHQAAKQLKPLYGP